MTACIVLLPPIPANFSQPGKKLVHAAAPSSNAMVKEVVNVQATMEDIIVKTVKKAGLA